LREQTMNTQNKAPKESAKEASNVNGSDLVEYRGCR